SFVRAVSALATGSLVGVVSRSTRHCRANLPRWKDTLRHGTFVRTGVGCLSWVTGPGGQFIVLDRAVGAPSLFHFVMIKPTHYDDDGYPIQWFRSAIPSNTLACLNGLAEAARQRQVLGPHVDIRLHTFDETNRRVRPDRIIKMIRKAGGKAFIGLV